MTILTIFVSLFGFLNPTLDIGVLGNFEKIGYKNHHNYAITIENVHVIYVDLSIEDCQHPLVDHPSSIPQVQVPARDFILTTPDPRVLRSLIKVCGINNIKMMFKIDTYVTRVPLLRHVDYVAYEYSNEDEMWMPRRASAEEWEQYFVIKDWKYFSSEEADEAYEKEIDEFDSPSELDTEPVHQTG